MRYLRAPRDSIKILMGTGRSGRMGQSNIDGSHPRDWVAGEIGEGNGGTGNEVRLVSLEW